MAISAWSLTTFRKLACVSVFVTILTNLRRTLELHGFLTRRNLVTSSTIHGAMRPKQRELRPRMVESSYVRPGPYIVAGFTTKRCPTGPALRHAVFELTVVWIGMTRRAAHILKMERQDFVGAACCSRLMTIGAGHGGVCSGQSETSVAMFRDRKRRAVEVLNRVAILAFVQIWSGGELALMSVFVTVRA